MQVQYKFDTGVTVRDKVTGFKGIVTGVASYITGCNQYAVSTKDNEAGSRSAWYDEQRLEQLDETRIVIDNEVAPGGPRGDSQAPLK